MHAIYRSSGWLLVGIATLHNVVGLVMGWDVVRDVAVGGFWNSVERGGHMDPMRSALLWFLLTGFFWWILGYVMQRWLVVTGEPLPRPLGWACVAAGAATAYVLPASGAWLFIPLGALVALGPARARAGTADAA